MQQTTAKTTTTPTTTRPAVDRRFCIAPMMDWTDRHCRYFHRLLTQKSLLYTEMVTTGAILHAGPERFLSYNQEEHPLALQLGGSNPEDLAESCRIASEYGYDEINLNVGCPSDRVQNGRFGACLMAEPELVAQCITAMQAASSVPVTIKHRIGIDDQDSYELLRQFVDTVAQTGCKTFIVHARKAILSGLSPKQNREVPPLMYERVYQLKADFPELEIIVNGGITSLSQAQAHLEHVDGVMVGREAYQNPYFLAQVDQQIFGDQRPIQSRSEISSKLYEYVEQQLSQGAQLGWIARHVLGLYQGQAGGRRFRRYISEHAFKPDADVDTLRAAVACVEAAPGPERQTHEASPTK